MVLRAGLTWQQVVILRSYAKYLRQAGFPYSQAHIERCSTATRYPTVARRALRGAVRSAPPTRRNAATRRPPPRPVAADIDALTSLDTDRVLRAFASMIQATLRTNYFVSRADSARAAERAVGEAESD